MENCTRINHSTISICNLHHRKRPPVTNQGSLEVLLMIYMFVRDTKINKLYYNL